MLNPLLYAQTFMPSVLAHVLSLGTTTNTQQHTLMPLQGFAAAPSTPGRAGAAATAEPCVAVACDNEVHLVSLSTAIHGPVPAAAAHAGGH